MASVNVMAETSLAKGQRAEASIPTNVRVYLGLSGKTQKALGEALGITKSAMSMKMCGKVGWSVSDLVTTADFLGVTPTALMDDTILRKAEAGYAKPIEYGVFSEKPGALVGAATPRAFVNPYNPDAPLGGGVAGADPGALGAPFRPAGVPARSGSHGRIPHMSTTVIMRTSEGDITINLFDDLAPETVANFVGLATGEKTWRDPMTGEERNEPFYDGLTFHRIIKDFMIQGGCPLGTGTGGPGYDFDDEIVPTLTFDHPYLLAMANAGLRRGMDGKIHGTNGSQFFITTVPTPWLDGHHTIFGEVANDESKAVVDRLEALPTDRSDRPMEPAGIISVEVVK